MFQTPAGNKTRTAITFPTVLMCSIKTELKSYPGRAMIQFCFQAMYEFMFFHAMNMNDHVHKPCPPHSLTAPLGRTALIVLPLGLQLT